VALGTWVSGRKTNAQGKGATFGPTEVAIQAPGLLEYEKVRVI